MNDKHTTDEWTAEYVEKLELNYGWEGVAHNHNAMLAARDKEWRLEFQRFLLKQDGGDKHEHSS